MSLQTLEENVNSNINEKIKQNNARAITGIILNGVLRNIISFVIAALGLFYTKEDINDKLEKIELTPGADGKSAYQIWLAAGNTGTEAEYLASLKGEKGDKGDTGEKGLDGTQGVKGDTGATGATGAQGLPGAQGTQGVKGDAGAAGATGAQGLQGEKGDTGAQGIQGVKGDTGDAGAQGAQGVKGDAGATGAKGDTGTAGADGKSAYQVWLDAGNSGSIATYLATLKGEKGDTGAIGAQGLPGAKGDTGAQGAQGVKGDTGEQGAAGAKGDTGAAGADGKSAYQVWLDAGNSGSIATYLATLKGEKGDTGAQGLQGIKGDTGATGAKGDTGAAGAQGLPGAKGDTGAQGIQGIQGLQGAKGDTGATGAQGAQGAKGDTGAAGAQGADGVLGSLTSLVTTATAFTLALASDTLLLGISKINATLNYLNDTKLTKTLTQNKLWIGNSSNVATESDILPEWTVGASQPGQKENKGLITEMIVADGSIIQIPTIIHKPITLTATGTIQLLSDTITGSYYVIESIVLIGRGISVSQNPIISIGCNASTYNDIAASQTLSTLANGLNTLTLTANASKAIVQANTNMFINITQALIGGGSFEIVIKGYLSKI